MSVDLVTIPPLRRDVRVHAWVAAAGLSRLGDIAWYIGLAWSAAQVAGPAGAGIVMGAGAIPRAVMQLFGGALADRVDARRTMVLANLARIAVLLGGIAVLEAKGLTLALLFTIAFVFGVVDAIYDPAASTMPRQLVRDEDFTSTAALFQLANRIAIFAGAPLGGFLVAHGGIRDVMVVNAVSFIAIAVVIATLLRPRRPRRLSEGSSIWSDLRDGFGYLGRTPPVRTLVIALSGLNLCVSPVLAVGLVLRTREADWGATTLGLFEATSGIGAAVGALVALRWRPADPARAGLLLLIIQAVACMAIGTAPYAGVFAAMATIGLTAGLASALLQGAFVAAVDESHLGRCISIVTLADEALMPVAMTGFGALIAGVGVDVACALVGAVFAITVVWAIARIAATTPAPVHEVEVEV
jgi:MFS family permease